MEALTHHTNGFNLSMPLPHGAVRYWRTVNLRRITSAYKAVFLCVKLYPLPIMLGLSEHAKAWPALRLVRQFTQLRHHNGVMKSVLSILSKDLPQ